MGIGYGLTDTRQAHEMARRVVQVLGGGDNAYKLLVETAQQETRLGRYRDPTNYKAGTGLCQNDRMPFNDTQARTKESDKAFIYEAFDVDVDAVEWRELENSPLLALIFCRLHYLLRPGAIPDTVQGRAEYWKRWYNSHLGAGTVEEYVANSVSLDASC